MMHSVHRSKKKVELLKEYDRMLKEKASLIEDEKMDLIKEKEKAKMDGFKQAAKLEKEKAKLENYAVKAKEEAAKREATLGAKLEKNVQKNASPREQQGKSRESFLAIIKELEGKNKSLKEKLKS